MFELLCWLRVLLDNFKHSLMEQFFNACGALLKASPINFPLVVTVGAFTANKFHAYEAETIYKSIWVICAMQFD